MPTSEGSAQPRAAHELATEHHTWSARVRWTHDQAGAGRAIAYTRNHAFSLGPVSFKESDPHPSSIDYLLGALGGDLLTGFESLAARRGVAFDALEMRLSGRLNNPLVFLGVVGETGHPGLQAVTGTLYISTDSPEDLVRDVWDQVLARSPLVNTLNRCAELLFQLRIAI